MVRAEPRLMQSYFYELVDRLMNGLQGAEVLTCSFRAERSDFVRLNRNRVRQAGRVTQQSLSLDLIEGQREPVPEREHRVGLPVRRDLLAVDARLGREILFRCGFFDAHVHFGHVYLEPKLVEAANVARYRFLLRRRPKAQVHLKADTVDRHAALDHAARPQALHAELAGGRVLQAIEPFGRLGLAGEVGELRHGGLHAVGHFMLSNARQDLGGREPLKMTLVDGKVIYTGN